jgi:hypothetical protein
MPKGARTAKIVGLTLVTESIALTILLAAAFGGLNYVYTSTRGVSAIALRPHPLMWVMIAVPLAFFLAILTCNAIVERLTGAHSHKLPRWLRIGACAIASIFLLVAVFNLPYHVRIAPTAIYDQRPGDWKEQEYRYTQVTAVLLAHYYVPPSRHSRGGPSAHRGLFVRLQDGSTWSLMNTLIHPDAETIGAAASYIAERSGTGILYPDDVIGMPSAEERSADARLRLVGFAVLLLALLVYGRAVTRRRRK